MRTSNLIILLCLSFSICSTKTLNAQANKPFLYESKVDILIQQFIDLDIFSGVVLISKNGETLYEKAFGLANRTENIPNTVQTHFDIGSMNKAFTKVIILQLLDEGQLSPDDKLGQFLDGFSAEAANEVTVAQLLAHRSGFGTYHTPEYFELPLSEKTLKKNVEFIRKEELAFKPGTGQQYSNSGYVLLGAIIEKVTGKSYPEVVEDRITKPLGMTQTYLRHKYSVPNRAIGYYKTMKGELLDNEHFQEQPTPAGGFMSTVGDISTFYHAFHYSDKLLNEQARQLDPLKEIYKNSRRNGAAIAHAGGFEGANTVDYEILRDSLSIIVFANMDEPVAEELGAGILAITRGEKPASPTLPAMQNVYQSFEKYGLSFVKTHWDSLIQNYHPSDPKDLILNQIGYEYLFEGNPESTAKAIEIFKLNTALFPGVANVWDSYGEGLLRAGDSSAALAAYQKALRLDPDLPTARKAVRTLQK